MDKKTCQELLGMFKIIGRLAELFEVSFHERFALCIGLLDRYCTMLGWIFALPQLQKMHVKLVDGMFRSLSLYVPWLQHYQSLAVDLDEEEIKCNSLIARLVSEACILFQRLSMDAAESTARFLALCTQTLRPSLQQNLQVQQLLQLAQAQTDIPSETTKYLWMFISNIFIYSPFGVRATPADVALKSRQLEEFLRPAVAVCVSQPVDGAGTARGKLLYAIHIANAVLLATQEGSATSREIALSGIGSAFYSVALSFPSFAQDDDLFAAAVELVYYGIEVFTPQLVKSGHLDLIAHVTSTICNYLYKLSDTNHIPLSLLENAFAILLSIVEEKSRSFDGIQKGIMQFCLAFRGRLGQLGALDFEVSASLYGLVGEILKKQWTQFFGSKIQSAMGKSVSLEHQQLFLELFSILASSFLRPETDLVRQNLQTISDLHNQFHLFEMELFKSNVFLPLASGMLDILLSKNLELMQDELADAFLSLVLADPMRFHTEFLPLYCRDKPATLAATLGQIKDHDSGHHLYSLLQ
ncbi:Exportin-6 [Kappamyces sp. JEL0680]|nr:Exportin-6 [Kappamyces sp. JEL0680]